jgi:LmbE family N-acetylglucosaminyl deacetylase
VSRPLPIGRVVVVSPHLDDAVLSLGAAMATWARGSARVELLTVLACNPDSTAPAGGWDARGGFASEGDSARGRREEDASACVALGITPTWLPFGSVDYERHASDEEVLGAVLDAVGEDSLVLLPGFPLSHPDHGWLVDLVAPAFEATRVGLYAEQPYTMRLAEAPQRAERLDGAPFALVEVTLAARIAKWRAIRAYRSQLPLLALRGVSRGPHRLALASELVAWPT